MNRITGTRKLLLCLLALCISGAMELKAQNGPLFAPVKKDGKWGYIDTSGKMVINNIFNEARGFSEGCASVRLANLWGYINSKGDWAIKPYFIECSGFHEGKALTSIIEREDRQTYPTYINHQRDVLFALDPREIGWNFCEGLVRVRSFDMSGAAYGWKDSTGAWVIKPKYTAATDFNEGEAAMMSGSKWGFVDKKGNEVIPPKYDDAYQYNEDIAFVKMGNEFQYIDKKGNTVFKAPFEDIDRLCHQGLIAVRKDGKMGFINKKGKLVIKPQFDNSQFTHFTEGLAPVMVKENGKELWGYINRKGKLKIKPQFDDAQNFTNGYSIIKQDGKYGFITAKGRIAIKPQFEEVHDFRYSEE